MGYLTYVGALGYQQITNVSAGTTALTVPVGSGRALIQVETQAVRWRDDGTNPTASVGMRLTPGDVLNYDGKLSAIRFIEEVASAKLNVVFYGT